MLGHLATCKNWKNNDSNPAKKRRFKVIMKWQIFYLENKVSETLKLKKFHSYV